MPKLIFLLLLLYSVAYAQPRVGNIYLERYNVFDSTDSGVFNIGNALNSLHIVTKPYVIKDELLFEEEDILNEKILSETERNLRMLDLFTDVRIELDSVGFDYYDVYVITKDRWSTTPSILFGTGGGVASYGGKLSESNFLGSATDIEFEGIYRQMNDIRWQGRASLYMPRIFRSDLALNLNLQANRFRTDQLLGFLKPYRNTKTEYSWGLNAINSFGADFLYFNQADTFLLLDFHERVYQAYFSKAWNRDSRLFMSALVEYHDVNRGAEFQRRAYDNSGKILLQFSSIDQRFTSEQFINDTKVENLTVGGYGRAVVGRIFPIGSLGENLYYLGAEGEQSYYADNIYLYGRLNAGSAFKQANARYTFQSFLGMGFYKLSKRVNIAARFLQETSWNWFALRQLVLDNDRGLRGYDVNRFRGDNRIISNFELRYFPDFSIWFLDISAAAFFDIGTAWEQSQQISDLRFSKSAGLGIRFHNQKLTGPNSIFRVDFAWNFDDNRLGGIVFTTNQLFNPMLEHIYKIPQIFGLDFDSQ